MITFEFVIEIKNCAHQSLYFIKYLVYCTHIVVVHAAIHADREGSLTSHGPSPDKKSELCQKRAADAKLPKKSWHL